MKNPKKLIRITTVPVSLRKLLEGQLNFMQQEYEVVMISSKEAELNSLGKEIGVRTFPVQMTREITPIKDIKAVYDLYRFFKREKPLIVHTHTPKAGIAGMMAAKLAGVPLRLHTVAGLPLLEAKGAKRKILEYVEKLTFSCATMVYPNSHKIHDFLLTENYAPAKKLKVLGNGSSNGIDTSFFNPELFSAEKNQKTRQSLNIPLHDIVFVFIGRLVKDKGINELVEAFSKLNTEVSNTSLLLVGNFEEKLDPLKNETIQKITSHSKIFEAGYQNDVRPFLTCSDVLAFPSYREGFPNVVMQAGAMGLPSIVTDINGCNEIVVEGENGLIIPVRDIDQTFLAMKRMVMEEGFRKKLETNSRKVIVEKYERRELWKILLTEYKNLEKKLNKKTYLCVE